MRKIILTILAVLIFAAPVICQESKTEDANKLFYAGNSYYEKRDYAKAAEEYLKIGDTGAESGNLYYNIGNSFFKLGKIGYAILNYERARKIIPQDRDLKANLAYAKSLVGSSVFQVPQKNPVVSAIKTPFKDFNITILGFSVIALYLIVISFSIFFLFNPFLAKRMWIVFLMLFILFIVSASAFMIRYYDEDFLKRGIVVQKEIDCKYEPIDKSTTYYKLQEGDEALILSTRGGWRQIRRLDGKIAWVKKESLEEI